MFRFGLSGATKIQRENQISQKKYKLTSYVTRFRMSWTLQKIKVSELTLVK